MKQKLAAMIVVLSFATSANAASKGGMELLYSIYRDECASSGNSPSLHFSMNGQTRMDHVKIEYDHEAFESVCAEVAEKVANDPNMAAQKPISFKAFKSRVTSTPPAPRPIQN